MTTHVARRYSFTAWHHLDGFAEPWCNHHMHVYTVEVVALSSADERLDTDDLDDAWQSLAPRENEDLNVHHHDTTVEELAAEWLSDLRGMVPQIVEVTVWEDRERWGRATT